MKGERKKYPRHIGVPFYFSNISPWISAERARARNKGKILFSFRVMYAQRVQTEKELTQKFVFEQVEVKQETCSNLQFGVYLISFFRTYSSNFHSNLLSHYFLLDEY